MMQIIIDDERPRPASIKEQINYTLLIVFLVIGAMGIACGYAIGVRDAGKVCVSAMEAQNAQH